MTMSYEYAVGSVRAKETGLLSRQDMEMLAASGSTEKLCSVLNDKGYYGDSVDEMLSNRSTELWAYVHSVAPDISCFNVLFYRNDVHNVKTVIKGILSGREYEHLLMTPCTVDTERVIKAVGDGKYDLLPEWLSAPAKEAFALVAHSYDARQGDALLDKALMKKMLELSEGLSDTVEEYFKTLVFYSNVKIALRSSRTGTTADLLKTAFCDVDGFDVNYTARCAATGEKELLDYLRKVASYGCPEAMAEYDKSPSVFEKFVDDKLMSIAVKCKYVSDGIDPLFGYIMAVEAEIKVIHIIASGIRTGQPEASIRERLRRIYGQ